MSKHIKIQEGINYLRLMNREMNVEEIAEEFNISEEHVKDCIKLARQHRDEAQKPPKVVFLEPYVKVHRDLASGELQVVKEVEVEILRDIIAKFSRDDVSEFQTMLPVKITIKRT